MERVISFLKKEPVLVAACLLAVLSAFFVPPDAEYLGYIDFRTLSILFCLMTVVAGLRGIGLFDILAQKMLSMVRNTRQLVLIPVLLCFFLSMFITNDVALITLVPFTFTVLELAGREYEKRLIVPVTAMETIAANLGSMLTPLGNPQNLYLFGRADMSIGSFLLLMLPYSALSLIMLVVLVLSLSRKDNDKLEIRFAVRASLGSKRLMIMYLTLFAICLLSVVRIVHYGIALAAVVIAVLFADRKNLAKADYLLLATFAGFFIFIGNMGRIQWFCDFLENVISGKETLTAVLSSQIISNVPAALLLSGFTDDINALIIGTNLGGLGTLIASMASLISFKQLSIKYPELKGRFMVCFTVSNVVFLVVLMGLFFVLDLLN
ncbi:MAG: SLC13 family permease [Oscillospiraceae bacterium]